MADLLDDAAGYPPKDRNVRRRLDEQHVKLSGQSYQALKGKSTLEFRATPESRLHKVPQLIAAKKAAAADAEAEQEQKRSRRNDSTTSGAAASSSGSGRNRDAASRPPSSGSGGSYYGHPQDVRSRR